VLWGWSPFVQGFEQLRDSIVPINSSCGQDNQGGGGIEVVHWANSLGLSGCERSRVEAVDFPWYRHGRY
jgi:hypothetical protein